MSKKNRHASQKDTVNDLKGSTPSDYKMAAKKAAVLGTEKKKRPPLYAVAAIALLVITIAVYVFVGRSQNAGEPIAAQFSSETAGDQITYPVGLFDDGVARHYEYKTGSLTIKYFVIKSSDGIIRAAFDACDVCWPAGKGYFQSGDVMVCRNCGRRFASVLVNEVQGGCNPAPLNRTIQNDQLVIKVTDILEGKQYFDFSRKA